MQGRNHRAIRRQNWCRVAHVAHGSLKRSGINSDRFSGISAGPTTTAYRGNVTTSVMPRSARIPFSQRSRLCRHPSHCFGALSRVCFVFRRSAESFASPALTARLCARSASSAASGEEFGQHRAAVADQGLERARTMAVAHLPTGKLDLALALLGERDVRHPAVHERRLHAAAAARPPGSSHDACHEIGLDRPGGD